MSEQKDIGKIIIKKSKKGKWIFNVDIGTKQPMTIPPFYDLKDDSFNGKECEVIREKGQIRRIIVDGQELPRKSQTQPSRSKSKKYIAQSYNKKNNLEDSFKVNHAKIPLDTKGKLQAINDIDNFNLKLNKYARFEDDKFLFFKSHKDAKFKIKDTFSNSDVEKIYNTYSSALKKSNLQIESISLKPYWRMIIGLGGESVYETSITLHHIYGVPYIPGQAVKGVVRSYYIKSKFEKIQAKWDQINIFENILENLDLKEDKKINYKKFEKNFSIKDRVASESLYNFFYENSLLKENIIILIKEFRDIFGTQKEQGKVIFFDSYPKTTPKITVDVMNPHYSDYYSGKKNNKNNIIPPADYHNPIPIYFLTVEDTEFDFFIGCKENIASNHLQKLKNLLKDALGEQGIGAKTAVGYGYMITV